MLLDKVDERNRFRTVLSIPFLWEEEIFRSFAAASRIGKPLLESSCM